MKQLIFSILSIVSLHYTYAQCPPGARATHSIWIHTYYNGTTWISDTSCSMNVAHFPANSTVYAYNNAPTLIDSFTTDATGFGYINLSPNRCITFGGGIVVGTAVSGTCTTNITGVVLLPIKIKYFTVNASDNKVTAEWQLQEETAGVKYSLLESNNGRDFTNLYTVSNAAASIPGYQYKYHFPQMLVSKKFYRLMVIVNTGAVEYSDIKTALPKGYATMDIYPVVSNGKFSVNVPANFINGEIRIFNTGGGIVLTKKISDAYFDVMLSSAKGAYYIKAFAPDGTTLVKTILLQ